MEIVTTKPNSLSVNLQAKKGNDQLRKQKKTSGQYMVQMFRAYVNLLQRISNRQAADFAFNRFISPLRYKEHILERGFIREAHSYFLTYNHNKLKVYHWGNYGPVVMLVHGWNSSSAAMTHYVDPLLSQGYRVVAFDAPAHGNSEGKQSNMLEYAQAISFVMESIGSNVKHIIAHSFGGSSTLFMMNHLKPKNNIEKLVLISTLTNLEYSTSTYANTIGLNEQSQKFLFDKIEKIFKSENLDGIDMSNLVKGFSHDICVVHDRFDKVVPVADAYNYGNVSKSIFTEGIGHTRILKDPEVIRQTVKFINE